MFHVKQYGFIGAHSGYFHHTSHAGKREPDAIATAILCPLWWSPVFIGEPALRSCTRISFCAAAISVAIPPALAAVVISSQATSNVSCSGGVCAPTAAKAVLNVVDLESLLASGNTEVTTTGSGVQAGTIALDAKLSWSAASTLELDAYQSITVQQPVSVMGSGGLTIDTNDGGSGGTFSFASNGSVAFQNLASPLTINGVSFTLVNSLPTLASAVNSTPAGAFALANSYDASQDGTYSQAPITETLEGAIEGLGNTISQLSIAVHGRLSFAAMIETVDTPGAVENSSTGEY